VPEIGNPVPVITGRGAKYRDASGRGSARNVPGRRAVLRRVGAAAPVVECLGAMVNEPAGLARSLHLDDADAVPDEVEETAVLGILEARDVFTDSAVAGEQLVEEGLRFGPLGAGVHAPLLRELGEAAADLLAGDGHGARSDGELLCGLGNGVVGALHEPAMHVAQLGLGLVESFDDVGVGAVLLDPLARAAGTLLRVRDEEEDLLDLAAVGLSHDRKARPGYGRFCRDARVQAASCVCFVSGRVQCVICGALGGGRL